MKRWLAATRDLLPRPNTDDSELDAQRLALDRQKIELDERWRHRTFLWTIGSAVLTAAVTIGVALIANGGQPGSRPDIAAGPVEACRDSLRRLSTLAGSVTGYYFGGERANSIPPESSKKVSNTGTAT